EIQQRARPLRKLEAEQFFVLSHGAAADHVPHVNLRQLVVAQVPDLVTERAKLFDEPRAFRLPVPKLYTGEDVRFGRIAVAIVELGDAAAPDRFAELPETPRLLRDLYCEEHLPLLAHRCAFGNVAQ